MAAQNELTQIQNEITSLPLYVQVHTRLVKEPESTSWKNTRLRADRRVGGVVRRPMQLMNSQHCGDHVIEFSDRQHAVAITVKHLETDCNNSSSSSSNISTVVHVMNTHTQTHTRLTALLSGTTPVSRYKKGKHNLDFTEARDSEWQWHQLGHMQVCISLQTDNHASTSPLVFYRPDALPVAQPTASKH